MCLARPLPVAQTFLSAGFGDFPVPKRSRNTVLESTVCAFKHIGYNSQTGMSALPAKHTQDPPQLPASSARSLEQSEMLFQPAFGCLVVGTDLFDFAPEPDRVVHLLQVRQLVQNQVVADEGRRLEEPPVQRNRPAPRAGAP